MRDMSIDSTQLFVKDRVQTLIDNVVIESVQNAARRWHTPARREESPVISKDRPWEYIPYFSGSDYTVLRDPEDGLFKCWYEDLDQSPQYTGASMGTVVHPGGARQCYAVSEDGVHWVKPELDVHEEDGRRTNIVMGGNGYGGAHALSVVIDPHARTRDERFRAVFTHLMRGGDGRHQSRIECARSPDGIHWQVYDEVPSFGMAGPHLGDVSVVIYDEDSREFIHNTRHPMQQASFGVNPRIPRNASFFSPYQPHDFASYNKRRIFQCRSHDFIHWSEPVLVAAPDDDEDNLDESFYGMAQYKLGTVHLATVAVLRGVENEMDVQLMVSRDGTRWGRTNKRQPFLAPRGDGHWDGHMVSMVSPPIDVGDETWFYHGGTDFHHDWWMFGKAEGLDHPEARSALGGSWGLSASRPFAKTATPVFTRRDIERESSLPRQSSAWAPSWRSTRAVSPAGPSASRWPATTTRSSSPAPRSGAIRSRVTASATRSRGRETRPSPRPPATGRGGSSDSFCGTPSCSPFGSPIPWKTKAGTAITLPGWDRSPGPLRSVQSLCLAGGTETLRFAQGDNEKALDRSPNCET